MKSLWAALVLIATPAWARLPDGWSTAGYMEANDRANRGSVAAPSVLVVKGPVKLRVKALAGDVEVVAGADKQVSARIVDTDGPGDITFRHDGGERIEVVFDGMPALRSGKVSIAVPLRSEVDISTDSGDVVVSGVEGEVRLRSAAGDLHVTRAGSVSVRSVSGDVGIEQASGEVRVETVSGDTLVATTTVNTKLQFASTSGDLAFRGACGINCEMELRTLSGDVELQLSAQSSFGLHFISHSGEIIDELGMTNAGSRPPRETNMQSRYGAADGLIECQTFSGDLRVARRR